MTRQHKSRYYPSEHLRSLQVQIDELWAQIEAELEEVANKIVAEFEVRKAKQGKPCKTVQVAQPGSVMWDQHHIAVTAEVADILKPYAFHIKNLGYGWYQVTNMDTGKPIHEGKLRKGPAEEAWKKAMQSAA